MATRKIPECLNDDDFLKMLDLAAKLGLDVKTCFRDILKANPARTSDEMEQKLLD